MRANEFPFCCAGILYCEFGNTTNAFDKTLYTAVEIKDKLKRWAETHRGLNYGFAMITINDDQLLVMKPVLRALKWKCIAKDIYHPRHNSRVFIYIKQLNQDHWRNNKSV